jgi:hypothetical protein
VSLTGDPTVDASLLAAARFVEAQRGLVFLAPVEVRLIDNAAFEAVVLQAFEDQAFVKGLRDQAEFLTVLEIIPEGTDYIEIARISMREGIIGLYYPSSGELYVRGTDVTPFVLSTVVHELTHALDDQHFDLNAVEIADGDADHAFAVNALAEGSADVVEKAYIDALSSEDRYLLAKEVDAFRAQMERPDLPTSVIEIGENAYSLGRPFVRWLLAHGGPSALDAAFEHPPRSTEQVLHPERFIAGETVVDVAVPPHDGAVTTTGTVGEEMLLELLSAEVAPAIARRAADGWGGDRYVLYTSGERRCVRLDVVADDRDAADELGSTFNRWSLRQFDAVIERVSPLTVRMTACR